MKKAEAKKDVDKVKALDGTGKALSLEPPEKQQLADAKEDVLSAVKTLEKTAKKGLRGAASSGDASDGAASGEAKGVDAMTCLQGPSCNAYIRDIAMNFSDKPSKQLLGCIETNRKNTTAASACFSKLPTPFSNEQV